MLPVGKKGGVLVDGCEGGHEHMDLNMNCFFYQLRDPGVWWGQLEIQMGELGPYHLYLSVENGGIIAGNFMGRSPVLGWTRLWNSNPVPFKKLDGSLGRKFSVSYLLQRTAACGWTVHFFFYLWSFTLLLFQIVQIFSLTWNLKNDSPVFADSVL